MKKLIALLFMMPGVSIACGDLSAYEVPRVSFAKVSLNEAVSRITKGMPFQLMFSGENDSVISARNVAGPLDQVLDALGRQAGVTWSKDRCVLTFSPRVDLSLAIRPGDVIAERLSDWAVRNGYSVSWEAAQFRAEGDLVIDQDIDKTLDEFKSAMNASGVNIDIFVYKNRVIRVTEAK